MFVVDDEYVFVGEFYCGGLVMWVFYCVGC